MARRLFLGIDVSTTGAKALLVDEKGVVAASATTALTLETPKPLWSEQDPHEWWKGTTASIRKALSDAGAKGEEVAAVGAYSKTTVDALKSYTFDRKALGARGLGYEKLDQLTIEVLLGVR